MRRFLKLHNLILLGMILGIAAGVGLDRVPAGPGRNLAVNACTTVGEIFVRLITMVMIPLVLSSLTLGMTGVGDPRKLGRIGLKAMGYFILTTTFAITIGLAAANVLKPGRRMDPAKAQALKEKHQADVKKKEGDIKKAKEWNTWEFVKSLFPKNVVAAMVSDPPQMLQIIVFAILLGLCVTLLPEGTRRPFLDFTNAFNEAMLKMIHLIMWTAPVGVLALMAKVILVSGLSILTTLAAYGVTVLAALAVHFFLVYSGTVWVSARLSPLDFFRALRPAHLTAFSTSSSAATLPVNMQCVQENLGVSKPVTSFVLPLGCTVNMDGTALYQGVAAVFIAQVFGMDLTLGQQATILLTATLASIGAAPVPGAGMVMLAIILEPLGIPVEGLALIFGIDRFLDMCRTVLNVTGDASCAVMIAATEGEKPAFRAP
ncbi:MAG: dicarboxylate/amino acid:cation symporter [Planctomycetes bacterium]|nr:dicarboxylate/amino acid:cation symporter [Planctomycetota bacterium]